MIHLTPLGLGTSTRHEHDECAEAVAGGRHEVRGGATKEEKICTTRAVATSPLQRVQERHGGDRETGQRNERDERHEAQHLQQTAVLEAIAIGQDVIEPLGAHTGHDVPVKGKDPATTEAPFL